MGLDIEKLGKIISSFRKKEKKTQQEVASYINVSRSTYLSIESGQRDVSLSELDALAKLFHFDIAEILLEIKPFNKPIFNIQKFRNTLLYILDKTRNKENIGKVVLFKLLYFSDFNYYQKYSNFLTGMRYSKFPMGPVPSDIYSLLEQELSRGSIEVNEIQYHGRNQSRYTNLIDPDLSVLSVEELKVIDDVINLHSNKNGFEISEYSHGDAPWLLAEDYEEVSYESVFKRTKNYAYE